MMSSNKTLIREMFKGLKSLGFQHSDIAELKIDWVEKGTYIEAESDVDIYPTMHIVTRSRNISDYP